MIGVTDYITAGFSFENFKKADFWINIVTTNVGIVSMIISILLFKTDKFKEQNEEYLFYHKEINDFRKEKYISPLMQRFYFEDNFKTKVIYYKEGINKEFSKIVPTEKDLEIFYNGTDEQKQENTYCTKMNYYEKILSQEYINRVVPKLNIKYPQIDDDIIFTGNIDSKQITDYVTKHKVKKVIIDYLPRFLFAFSLTILGSGLVPDLKSITSAVIIKTVMKLFTIISQLYFAISYADKYNKEVTLHDIMFRHKKINEYKLWENKQLKNVSKGVDD
jgi:hypothetical protein